MGGIVDLL